MTRPILIFLSAAGVFLSFGIVNHFRHDNHDVGALGRMLFGLLLVVYVGLLVWRDARRAVWILTTQVVALLFALLVVEGGLQLLALRRPSYDVVYFDPHRVLGWKGVPDLEFIWTGNHWYAADFTVPVKLNSRGFRDREHPLEKPAGTRRIAMLGDSFVEAVQVPFEQTAGHLIEQKLGAGWEVVNFGVSSFGVGQFLLMWETEAHRFRPDHVLVMLAELHFYRTMESGLPGFIKKGEVIDVRPTFRLDGDKLIRIPAAGYDEYVRLHRYVLEHEFHGHRSRTRPREWLTASLLPPLWSNATLKLSQRWYPQPPPEPVYETWPVNFKILEELNRQVQQQGSQLIVADWSMYYAGKLYGSGYRLPGRLKEFCSRNGIGYIPLSDGLLAAEAQGIPLTWKHDQHFNATGNRIFADAVTEFLKPAPQSER